MLEFKLSMEQEILFKNAYIEEFHLLAVKVARHHVESNFAAMKKLNCNFPYKTSNYEANSVETLILIVNHACVFKNTENLYKRIDLLN